MKAVSDISELDVKGVQIFILLRYIPFFVSTCFTYSLPIEFK